MSGALARAALRRAGQLGVTFAGLTLATFVLVRLAPGTPLASLEDVSPASLAAWQALRADAAPLWRQYPAWLARVVTLDFGRSLVDGRPVTELLAEALPRTALLVACALVVSYGLALPLGVVAATRRGQGVARGLGAGLLVAYSLPQFITALVLVTGFAAGHPFAVFPLRGLFSPEAASAGVVTRGLDLLHHLVLPVACLALPLLARTARLVRASLESVLALELVRAARARGLSERRVLWAHAVPNALVPLVALLAVDVPAYIGGSVIIERVFTVRGMGLLSFEAVLRRDYPVVLGITVVVALIAFAAVVVADLVHLLVNPRARRRALP